MRTLLLPAILLGIAVTAACGGGTTEESFAILKAVPRAPEAPAAPAPEPAAAPAMPAFAVPQFAPRPAPPAAARAAAGVSDLAKGLEVTKGPEFTQEDVALVSQQRIIVRTVNMDLEVADVSEALDGTAELAEGLRGWVVSSDRSEKHRGSISIRVPAEELDVAISRLREMALDVESEVSTSKDVTDEYVDTTARLRNFEATEEALLKLLNRADAVEEALKVQQELTKIQGEIERLQGRIKFLEQTSAFSLINVSLRLAPVDMFVDPGPEQAVSVGQIARFRATFKPPEDIEDFTFTWDFGDGSRPLTSDRTAPTLEEDTRVTATVTHIYPDDRDSPFIAEIEIVGTGDAGVAEGKNTVIER